MHSYLVHYSGSRSQTGFLHCQFKTIIPQTSRKHWRIKVSVSQPPNTRFVVVGIQNTGSLPIHDRWWLTKNNDLNLGTSLNGLGNNLRFQVWILMGQICLGVMFFNILICPNAHTMEPTYCTKCSHYSLIIVSKLNRQGSNQPVIM